MTRKYISAVTPLKGHVLQVDFVTGSRLLLDMSRYLDKLRFRPLANPEVWNSAVTNGISSASGTWSSATTRSYPWQNSKE